MPKNVLLSQVSGTIYRRIGNPNKNLYAFFVWFSWICYFLDIYHWRTQTRPFYNKHFFNRVYLLSWYVPNYVLMLKIEPSFKPKSLFWFFLSFFEFFKFFTGRCLKNDVWIFLISARLLWKKVNWIFSGAWKFLWIFATIQTNLN
jgi:hypothetical protein